MRNVTKSLIIATILLSVALVSGCAAEEQYSQNITYVGTEKLSEGFGSVEIFHDNVNGATLYFYGGNFAVLKDD